MAICGESGADPEFAIWKPGSLMSAVCNCCVRHPGAELHAASGKIQASKTPTQKAPIRSVRRPSLRPVLPSSLSRIPCTPPSREMGRRKIEIQPITHERNRSVTFLKRKNGLFKKAYELGVLCSVDVAVIIFEERPGHHLKLYQYCSGDIHDIVQRHVRYDGEKDTRTPHDFANNAIAKIEDAGDGDDDDADDDDPDSNSRGPNKKRTDTKLKQEFGNNAKLVPSSGGDLGLNVEQMNDYSLHRPMTIPQPPMPLHPSTQLPPASVASSLPISTERHTSTGRLLPIDNHISSQKKPRLAPNVSAGNNPKLSDDSMYNGYLPPPTSTHPPNNYRQNGHSPHQMSYNYLGVATSAPQQPFLPSSSFDFPSSSRGPQYHGPPDTINDTLTIRIPSYTEFIIS
ncbi:hypothetical protein JVT61DRAFT_447 [Boletus reticuloceps]|uniref:MADS-box domain-containing protein n=1 Tax=Boletus reticuloceps TaxID=495285 RepID=A0A8I2Z1Q1_9AGAM|nr:hypothetical protein JVT61DRAFT_447 [Boletus reticuloceps]